MDQPDFPRTRPMLHIHLALLRREDVIMPLGITQPLNPYRFVKLSVTPSRCSHTRRGRSTVVPTYSVPLRRLVMM